MRASGGQASAGRASGGRRKGGRRKGGVGVPAGGAEDGVVFAPWPDVAAVDCAVWAGWSVAMSWRGLQWSQASLERDSWVTRPRGWERGGRLYEHLGVRRWRRSIPDAGRLFGGRPRQLLHSRDPDDWRALAAETRRAERVHWWIVAALPILLLWNRGILLVAMVAYTVAANGPCLVLQRYNRARVRALLARRDGRPDDRRVRGGRRPGTSTGRSGSARR